MKKGFIASEENANTLESWNGDTACTKTNGQSFYLAKCAANCYIQWFLRLSCHSWEIPFDTQVETARAVLHRFNVIIILEKLKDPEYVVAMENFFGVAGLTQKQSAWCEPKSHEANEKFPLKVEPSTIERLTTQNKIDIDLYNNITNCLEDRAYDFPKWNSNRFESNNTLHVHHEEFAQWKLQEQWTLWDKRMAKLTGGKAMNSAGENTKKSPACEPHFNVASVGGHDNKTQFTRLYFYHSRKA